MTMKMYDTIGSSINYGGLHLKNRIIFAPTTMGLPKPEYLEKIRQIAEGGCAMIIIGDVPVKKSSFGHSLFSKKGFAFYQEIAETAHKYNCRLCAQLHQSDLHIASMLRYIPGMIRGKITADDLRRLQTEHTGDYISSIPAKKVKEITGSFGDAAVMAVKAGFDMVQVHGDRMCGSFSSTVFNHRTDQYGGSVKNRTRFAVESVRAIREKLPDLPIDYKLAVRQENPHYGNAGILKEELDVFVPALEMAGVTSFHVALANHSRLEDVIPEKHHPDFGDEGCFLPYCDEVRKYTDLPICSVGGFTQPDFVEQQLKSGRVECVGMSRQLIADPEWVNKVMQGKEGQIRHCLRCNKKCLGGMYEHKGVHCVYEGGKI